MINKMNKGVYLVFDSRKFFEIAFCSYYCALNFLSRVGGFYFLFGERTRSKGEEKEKTKEKQKTNLDPFLAVGE
jgi:hypothetical protein